jgi:hypothetical protein
MEAKPARITRGRVIDIIVRILTSVGVDKAALKAVR